MSDWLYEHSVDPLAQWVVLIGYATIFYRLVVR
jgi:hypothetical protein